jgi:hypothetical protein
MAKQKHHGGRARQKRAAHLTVARKRKEKQEVSEDHATPFQGNSFQ